MKCCPGGPRPGTLEKSYSEGIIKIITSQVIRLLRHSEWTLVRNKEMVDPTSVLSAANLHNDGGMDQMLARSEPMDNEYNRRQEKHKFLSARFQVMFGRRGAKCQLKRGRGNWAHIPFPSQCSSFFHSAELLLAVDTRTVQQLSVTV
jgi:hypothetical protein